MENMTMADKKAEKVAGSVVDVEVKQKVSVFDLDAGEDTDITIVYRKYSAGKYDEATLEQAQKLVQPVAKQIDALLYRAQQESYQEGKKKALSAGRYLTSDVISKGADFLRANVASFADVSAKDAKTRFTDGVKNNKPGAMKVLQIVSQDSSEFGDF